jgi:hypothetical protein
MRTIRLAALVALTVLSVAPAALAQTSVPDPYTGDPQAVPKEQRAKPDDSVGRAIGEGAVAAAEEASAAAKQDAAPPEPRAQAAQEPEPPSGEPQPGEPDEPEPDEPDEPEVPGATGPVGGTGGTLPRTGLETLWIALAGIALLIAGWRLHLVARVREVIRRLRTPKEALREELETLLEAGAEQERAYATQAEPPVEPATPVGRRASGED